MALKGSKPLLTDSGIPARVDFESSGGIRRRSKDVPNLARLGERMQVGRSCSVAGRPSRELSGLICRFPRSSVGGDCSHPLIIGATAAGGESFR